MLVIFLIFWLIILGGLFCLINKIVFIFVGKLICVNVFIILIVGWFKNFSVVGMILFVIIEEIVCVVLLIFLYSVSIVFFVLGIGISFNIVFVIMLSVFLELINKWVKL